MSETAWDVLTRLTGSRTDVSPEEAIRALAARVQQLEAALSPVDGLIQRLEAHSKGCCKLDARDREALQRARATMSNHKIGDSTICWVCGAPAKYVAISTFQQYEPDQIRFTLPIAPQSDFTTELDFATGNVVVRAQKSCDPYLFLKWVTQSLNDAYWNSRNK